MYSPLYRLEQEFNRQGLRLSRQTMANWLLNTLGEMAAAGLRCAARAALQGVGAARGRDDLAGAERTGTFLHQQVLHVAVPHQRLRKAGHCAV